LKSSISFHWVTRVAAVPYAEHHTLRKWDASDVKAGPGM